MSSSLLVFLFCSFHEIHLVSYSHDEYVWRWRYCTGLSLVYVFVVQPTISLGKNQNYRSKQYGNENVLLIEHVHLSKTQEANWTLQQGNWRLTAKIELSGWNNVLKGKSNAIGETPLQAPRFHSFNVEMKPQQAWLSKRFARKSLKERQAVKPRI